MDTKDICLKTDKIVQETGTAADKVIPILTAIQKKFNYLPQEALIRVSETTDITPAALTGVSTFYSLFRHTRVGRHIIRVCTGTACHIKGAELVYEAFCRELSIQENSDTDPKGEFTIQRISCLGCCTIAPVVQIDQLTFGRVKPDRVANVLADFSTAQISSENYRGKYQKYPLVAGNINIGLGSCCIASGSKKIQQALDKSLADTGINTRVKQVGCVGMCHRTPLLEIAGPQQESRFYEKVSPHDVKKIILSNYRSNSMFKRLKNRIYKIMDNNLFRDEGEELTGKSINLKDKEIDRFLGKQVHISTEHSGQIDPLNFNEYCAKEGFSALKNTLKNKSGAQVISQIKASGLRGRGGAGFPTGEKLELTSEAEGDIKYLICNGDEGDPGAFMDRMILESYPFRVIEGIMLLAYAAGASQGYLYIRAEYPLALQRIKQAIITCQKSGLLGENILNSGFSLHLEIIEGAGAFVCGEETALIASIEGKRGNPRLRPPYPALKGLRGKPTMVSNCETLAAVPWILRNGPPAFARLGTKKSKGTKVFSLAGKIARGGLIEVPMGISIKEIVEEIGGGCEKGRSFKAIQVGGPSGGCIPAALSHIKVDYEELNRAGAMMGSGGLLVMDDRDCMVEIARYFLTFTCNQSCGKCTFCRIGTRMMLNILENLCAGRGKKEDLVKLEEIARKTKTGSLCGLGKTAPNPVLTTLTYFRDEYEAHLQGICPAKYCRKLITYSVNSKCIGCTICAQQCPFDAIPINPYQRHEINQEKCQRCGACMEACPSGAIDVK